MKYAIIGLGNMAQSMVASLLEGKALAQEELILYSRTPESIEKVRSVYPATHVAPTLQEAVSQADIICVCVYTHFVIETIEKFYKENFKKPIIYISPSIKLTCLEERFEGIQATMLIPTVASLGGEGVTLFSSNQATTQSTKECIKTLFGKIGMVKEYYGTQMFLATVLTSCMPAFVAKIIESFETVGVELEILSASDIQEMVAATFSGTANLILTSDKTPRDIQEMVATKGGITEKGLLAMSEPVAKMVEDIYRATLQKLGVSDAK